MLCGFSSHQLDRVPNSYRNEIGIYFNLSTVVGLVGDDSYCAMNTPPTNIDIISSSLGAGVHNFTNCIDRKICSIENHEGKHHIVQKFKNPPW